MKPIKNNQRIVELDIIRGFALFGVLLMNLLTQSYTLAPSGTFDAAATHEIDGWLWDVADVFFNGKSITLFSMLFGFGFAMILERMREKSSIGDKIFLRRMLVLLLFGMLHILFIWIGDILHVYALMGFVLYLMRNWSSRNLLIGGLFFVFLSSPISELVYACFYTEPFPWWSVYDDGALRRFDIMLRADYIAYVSELWRAAVEEMWGTPDQIPYMLITLGRFMIGAWIFRLGWMQNLDEYQDKITRLVIPLLVVGFASALLIRWLENYSEALSYSIKPIEQMILALAYAALLVKLWRSNSFSKPLMLFAGVGKTALSNYIFQSFVYIFVLYGFGFGLLRVLTATNCFLIAVLTFTTQLYLSKFWLARYRYGPLEALWRWLTYPKNKNI